MTPRKIGLPSHRSALRFTPISSFTGRLTEDQFEIVARDESAEFWEFLDDYRDEPEAPPSFALPDHVEIAADGNWAWPQAWMDAGVTEASLVLRGAGGGGQGGARYTPPDPDPKGGHGGYCTNGAAGAQGSDTRVTLAGGEIVVAEGGWGGPNRDSHNALGEPGGRGGSPGWTPVGCSGGRSGQAGELVSRTIVAADAPLQIDLGTGGSGGNSGNLAGGRGSAAKVLIYPLPP